MTIGISHHRHALSPALPGRWIDDDAAKPAPGIHSAIKVGDAQRKADRGIGRIRLAFVQEDLDAVREPEHRKPSGV